MKGIENRGRILGVSSLGHVMRGGADDPGLAVFCPLDGCRNEGGRLWFLVGNVGMNECRWLGDAGELVISIGNGSCDSPAVRKEIRAVRSTCKALAKQSQQVCSPLY
eukprot:g33271.t1